MQKTILIAAYVFMTVWTAGTLNANIRAEFSHFQFYCEARDGRKHLVFAIGFSLLPPAWLIVPISTGFYQDGWTLEHGAWGTCANRRYK